jgi:subtilisin family serine protease
MYRNLNKLSFFLVLIFIFEILILPGNYVAEGVTNKNGHLAPPYKLNSIAASSISSTDTTETSILPVQSPELNNVTGSSGSSIEAKNQSSSDKNKIQFGKPDFQSNRFIVKYKTDSGRVKFLNKFQNMFNKKSLRNANKKGKNRKFDVIDFGQKKRLRDLADEIVNDKLDSEIEYIQPDYAFDLSSSDLYYNNQWGVFNSTTTRAVEYTTEIKDFRIDAGVGEAWTQAQGDGVLVALIDTGVDTNHEDLTKNMWTNQGEVIGDGIDNDSNGYIDDVNGWNMCDDNSQVYSSDDTDHGTHIAGIIAAEKDNNKGIAGVAPSAKILPLKVFRNGTAYTSDIIEAINYAENAGAKIVNCSWGTTMDNPALKETMQQSGMLFVCAAGNNGADLDTNPVYPASFKSDNIISVASISKNGSLAATSNYGKESVLVAAPGEGIYSALPGNTYGYRNGTSMAAGFVSGEAALLIKKFGDIPAGTMKQKISESSDRLSTLDGKVYRGNKINAVNAVKGLKSDTLITIGAGVSGNANTDNNTQTKDDGFSTFYSTQEANGRIFSIPAGAVDGQLGVTVKGNTVNSKSTNRIRIKSVGKNLFNINGDINNTGGSLNYSSYSSYDLNYPNKLKDNSSILVQNLIDYSCGLGQLIKVKPNTTYYYGGKASTEYDEFIFIHTANGDVMSYLAIASGTSDKSLYTTAANETEILITFSSPGSGGWIQNVFFSEQDLSSSYEPYTESEAYISSELRSFPDGANDEVKINANGTGAKTQRIKQMILTEENIVRYEYSGGQLNLDFLELKISDNDTCADFYLCLPEKIRLYSNLNIVRCSGSGPWITFYVPRDTYSNLSAAKADLSGKVLEYELEFPIVTQLDNPSLSCKPGGTVYIENAVQESSTYNNGIVISNSNLPIKTVDSVSKMVDGSAIPVPLYKVTTAGNGLSFTIDGAQNGEQYRFSYIYDDSLSTMPTIEFVVPTSLNDQINDTKDAQQAAINKSLLEQDKKLGDQITSNDSKDAQQAATINSLLERIKKLEEQKPIINAGPLKINCTANANISVVLSSSNSKDFSNRTFKVIYNASELDVVDLCAETSALETSVCNVNGTNIVITNVAPGLIEFFINNPVEYGKTYSGAVNTIVFKPKTTGQVTLSYTAQ